MLDERFRRFVADVAAADEGALDAEARERIIARVRASGPSVVSRARRARVAMAAAGPFLAAAAAVAVWVHRPRAPVQDTPSTVAVVSPGAPAAPACSSRPAVDAQSGFVANANGSRLDLGAVALAAGQPGAVVRLTEASPCRTAIGLESGTVVVHAKDLGGGELRVRAPGGEVTVHGTIFGVTQGADAFVVEVVEGRVGVVDRAGSHTVSAGERLSVSSAGVDQGALSLERARALRQAVGAPQVIGLDTLPTAQDSDPAGPRRAPAPTLGTRALAQAAPAPEAPPPPAVVELAETQEAARAPAVAPSAPSDPLALAEQARRAGDFQKARELYRRAGDRVGATAEAAWVALARMELSLGHASGALDATKRRQERFGQGTLGPEALWIDVRAYRQMGDMGHARELAQTLVTRWPSSPQARAAEQWLSAE